MSEYLFSYGTLQKNHVQLELFGRLLNGAKDVLEGFKVSTILIKDESFLSKGGQEEELIAIRANNGIDRIEGMAFEISAEELLESDKYEPEDYERIKVVLRSGKEAWIYAERRQKDMPY